MPKNNNTESPRNPVALVTGGTTGIGLVACQQLVAQGIDVIFTSRSQTKGDAAVDTILSNVTEGTATTTTSSPKVRYVIMELSDLSSVAKACDEILRDEPARDFLLLNAGIMGVPGKPMETTVNGIEQIVGVNHVAAYYIAHKMLPLLGASTAKSSPPIETNIQPTITFVSSDLHNIHSPTGAANTLKPIVSDDVVRFCSGQGILGVDASAARASAEKTLEYNPTWSYKYSKLLNVLTMQAIHQRLIKSSSVVVQCNSMEPGFIPQSDLSREGKAKFGSLATNILLFNLYHGPINWLVSYLLGQPVRTLEEGGKSEVFAVTKGTAGKYYRLDEVDPPSPLVTEMEVVEGFYKATADLLKEKGFPIEAIV